MLRSARRTLIPLDRRGPLRVMFVVTSMPVGGAETLLVEIARRLDRRCFQPELCCLKRLGPLGELLAEEIPAFSGLLSHKYEVAVLHRLLRLWRQRRIDAVVTVGPGDKMFWGRLSAWLARVPVIVSALHSTGIPDGVSRANRLLHPLTDAFVAVADSHARYLAQHEGCPSRRVRVIRNGVDVQRFHPRWADTKLREQLGLPPGAPVVGIVAALRPEKNHELFLEAAALIRRRRPETQFLIVGDGPRRRELQSLAEKLGLAEGVHFLGTRPDIPQLLSLLDVFVLSSKMEANPISLLEAMATEIPVVAPSVGSIPEVVVHGRSGYLTSPGQAGEIADRVSRLLNDPQHAAAFGRAGREEVILRWSIEGTVEGYQDLIAEIYRSKLASAAHPAGAWQPGTGEGHPTQRVAGANPGGFWAQWGP